MNLEQEVIETEEFPTLSLRDLEKLEAIKAEILRNPQLIDLIPFTAEQVKFSANGIELKREHSGLPQREGDLFENRCFSRILSKPGQSIIFGPCITDVLLNQRFTLWNMKPDGIAFDISKKGLWKLTELYEFKSARKTREVGDKLFGFSQLLNRLRENPQYLPCLFSHAFRKLMKVPDSFEFPDDSQLTVKIAYPSKGPITTKPETPFRLKYFRVPK
ncbi:hypothetical protein A3F02_00995 [Candidatus Curtissbacteria bacterium RIFCSPHIGHO2_12_FULL_38_9b]|uniref:Restriction endonuclease n=1 Tax=Candidatus Curtissbacteria bacterium RIFCSPHIGHO2_12_FULL_38_9b TaxID=1797720 RepID=A0A1F5GVV1_9BACT|nr:MAG: hypothetical protein A3F02_00995 [Candidatus Curtissbacteria bacterium RIFCSPHIGHO2_12_FULL_38_9b]